MLPRSSFILLALLALLLGACDEDPAGLDIGEECSQDSQCRSGLFCDPSTQTCQSADAFRDRPEVSDTTPDDVAELPDVPDEDVPAPECEEGDTRICSEEFTNCGFPLETCVDGQWGECLQRTPEPEICDDIDNDCDGAVDEQVQLECGTNVGICSKGVRTCNAGIFGPCKGDREGTEEACDGVDNNCDGNIDETCTCVDGDTQPCGTDEGTCTAGTQTCNAGVWSACEGVVEAVDEICDGLDNNCNGEVDDGVTRVYYYDGDGDGFGDPDRPRVACERPDDHAENDLDCDDADPERYPNNPDVCDGRDNDCDPRTPDGAVEDWFEVACDGPDTDLCLEGIDVCEDGARRCTDDTGDNLEICDGEDNDCNPETVDGSGESWVGADCDGDADTDLCKEGVFSCEAGMQRCSDETDSQLELCDGVDNDCNPETPDGSQEDWAGEPCDGPDSDFCNEGVIACDENRERVCTDTTGDNLEICDGRDNDCDPSTRDGEFETWIGTPCDGPDTDLCQEGALQCTGGGRVCSDATDHDLDLCDGLDNDCNPASEDGSGELWFGRACDGDDLDFCEEGVLACDPNSFQQVCTDTTGEELELCDGVDNDCDPATPDGSQETWFGRACDGKDGDLCQEGSLRCTDGAQRCSDTTGTNLEICDGLNNDCDDSTVDGADESWIGGDCDGPDTDLCREGVLSCVDGGRACDDTTSDDVEVCDGDDNDCDGDVDEGLQCNTPPVAVCPTDMEADPLATINLDGTGSYDPEGDPLTFTWTVVTRPSDSNSSPDQPSQANSTFFIDVAGTNYTFQLEVSDGVFTDTCTFNLVSVPPQDLHVRLVWKDGSGDIDLHLTAPDAAPLGAFFTSGTAEDGPELDVWWAQRLTEWGPSGDDGNGTLDIDDTAGYGPENINIFQNPQIGGTYTIGVHHYCDQSIIDEQLVGVPSAHEVRVRVYCDGELQATFPSPTTWYSLNTIGDFWIPASVTWQAGDTCTVNPIDTLEHGIKYCVASGLCQYRSTALDCRKTQVGTCTNDAQCRPFEFCSVASSECRLNQPCTTSSECTGGMICDSRYGLCTR